MICFHFLFILYANAMICFSFSWFVTLCIQTQWRPRGSETLPQGIVARTSDYEMRSLSGKGNKKVSSYIDFMQHYFPNNDINLFYLLCSELEDINELISHCSWNKAEGKCEQNCQEGEICWIFFCSNCIYSSFLLNSVSQCLSFHQVILWWCSFIMMALWMLGGIWNGVPMPSMSLLLTKLNGN